MVDTTCSGGPQLWPHAERGQIALVAAVAAMVAAVGVVWLATVAGSMLQRQQAAVAADAIALADANGTGGPVAAWYRARGVEAEVRDGASNVVGEATAQSRAWRDESLSVAPALVAVVARAEQLLGHRLESAVLDATTVTLSAGDHERFTTVAYELVMCPVLDSAAAGMWQLC